MAMTLKQLREKVRGEVVVPGDDTYDEARSVHNGMIVRHPALVVRVANAGDVMAAVTYARENGLDLAIRGGGHSAPASGPSMTGSWLISLGCALSGSTRWRQRPALTDVPPGTVPLPMLDPEPSAAPEAEAS